MWLTVEHTTRFTYDAPVSEAYTEIRLKPAHGNSQRCSSFSLEATPQEIMLSEYVDSFGNAVHHFDVLESHSTLVVAVRSEVWTPEAFADERGAPSPLDRWDLLRASRYVPLDGAISELSAAIPDGPPTIEQARELMAAVRARMTYERGSTHVHTRADEALADGAGVCQDFAHVLIGISRVHGIPARYVSGYLYDATIDPDVSASHGWVDVHVDDLGWISLDPTHDRMQDERYVRVATGRDYGDVPPTRGVYKGTARETLAVEVKVSAI